MSNFELDERTSLLSPSRLKADLFPSTRFYYIDEHLQDGGPGYNHITGSGHADIVWELLQDPKQTHWRVS